MEVPAAREAVKVFELLIELGREGKGIVRVSGLADVLKSGYFRPSEDEPPPRSLSSVGLRQEGERIAGLHARHPGH